MLLFCILLEYLFPLLYRTWLHSQDFIPNSALGPLLGLKLNFTFSGQIVFFILPTQLILISRSQELMLFGSGSCGGREFSFLL